MEHGRDYWWVVLSTSLRVGNVEEAANAVRHLRELGVEVRLAELVTKPLVGVSPDAD